MEGVIFSGERRDAEVQGVKIVKKVELVSVKSAESFSRI